MSAALTPIRCLVTITPDDAVAPFVPAGFEIVFEVPAKLVPGMPVLVQSADGRRRIRFYEARPGSSWRAVGSSDAFETFDSADGSLELIGSYRWTNYLRPTAASTPSGPAGNIAGNMTDASDVPIGRSE